MLPDEDSYDWKSAWDFNFTVVRATINALGASVAASTTSINSSLVSVGASTQALANAVGLATSTLAGQVAVSTAAIGQSTAAITAILTQVGTDTQTLRIGLTAVGGSTQTLANSVGASTSAIAVSTGIHAGLIGLATGQLMVLATTYVDVAGDTMTGPLNLTNVAVSATGANGNIVSQSSITTSGGLFGDGAEITGRLNASDVYTTSGTWTPTFGGFSVAPSGCVTRFRRIGKLVWATLTQCAAGTSNATTFTVTLPVAAAAAFVAAGMGNVMDNGSFLANPGRLDTRGGSTTADVYSTLGAAAWTASGGKTADLGQIIYEAQ